MQKSTINGLKVLHERKPGNTVVVQVSVGVGSNQEELHERGISHFLEHLLFEGTVKRPSNELISNEIETIGGEFNAYTTNERTCFYVRVLKKHFAKAVEILADIMQNPLFKEEHITKEKNIVLKEIDMMHDEPSYYQWIMLQNNIFTKHPARNPTYGDRKIIKGLTREKVVAFYDKHYHANNMTLSIVGEVDGWKKTVEKYFALGTGKKTLLPKVVEPIQKKNKIVRKKRKMMNSYTIFGFKTVPRKHQDSYALEVLNGILGRGQSGKMFVEIRSKRGLAYEVGTQNVGEIDFGFFAVYASVDRKNIPLVRKLVMKELHKCKNITEDEVKKGKDFVEGHYLLELDDAQKVADQLVFWEQVGKAELMKSFVNNIRKVSSKDIKRVINKYFNHYTQAILEGN